ncbi:hypothetical protein HUU42_13020 [bacterium]|nr:hypothetical protein [bacterium]
MNPLSWQTALESEMRAAQKAWIEQNDGRARACVRRAVGIILSEYNRAHNKEIITGKTALDRLRHVASDSRFPEEIRKAATRLTTNVNQRLTPHFTFHPLNDANILIVFFQNEMARPEF